MVLHFNVRLINYPNGERQLRYYSVPQYLKDELPQDLEVKKKKEKRKEFEKTHALEPFTNTWVKEIDTFEDAAPDTSDNKHSFFVSVNRSKNAVYSYARCEIWEWFVTFTINAKNKDRYDYDECSKAVRQWLNNQRKRYAPDLKYLVVPEKHEDGAWHFHGVLCNTGEMTFTYSGFRDKKGKMVFNCDNYSLGFTTATRVQNVHKVAKYVGKYITKTLCELTPGRQRYFVSKTINKPDSLVMMFDRDEDDLYDFVVTLANSCGQELKHVSSVGNEKSYTKVKYFEIQ